LDIDWGICQLCQLNMKSAYSFKDIRGDWHYAHKGCCNLLKKQIDGQIFKDSKTHKYVPKKYTIKLNYSNEG
jgi:hypothetical protein